MLSNSLFRLSYQSSLACRPAISSSRFYSSGSNSGEDPIELASVQHGVLRNLPIQVWSSTESRWTREYDPPSHSTPYVDIVTWNVDFKGGPVAADRVSCILDHLRDVILPNGPQTAVILLQELNRFSFPALLEHSWVREHFAVTPPGARSWPGGYGIATLVSRKLQVGNARMLGFHKTRMGRTAVFVDVPLQRQDEHSDDSDRGATVRIANTHLESLTDEERARPAQLQAIADMLRAPGAYAGVVGGDMNMVGRADQDIHEAAGLRDAGTDGPESLTWGFQPRTGRWAPKRLDRVFYTPVPGFVVDPVKVIGKGLKTERGEWASDHYGLLTRISLA